MDGSLDYNVLRLLAFFIDDSRRDHKPKNRRSECEPDCFHIISFRCPTRSTIHQRDEMRVKDV